VTTVRLTRRQWLELPVEYKDQQGMRRFIVTDGRNVPVVFVKRIEDSHLKGVDTTASGQ
jgi:hypothetical protein